METINLTLAKHLLLTGEYKYLVSKQTPDLGTNSLKGKIKRGLPDKMTYFLSNDTILSYSGSEKKVNSGAGKSLMKNMTLETHQTTRAMVGIIKYNYYRL